MESHHKKLGFLILICFLLPSFIYLSRPTFYGLDSHYYLTKICSTENHYSEEANLPLTNFVFDNLPCDFTTLKLILIGLYGLSLIALFKIGEITWKGGGFYIVLFTGISTAFLYSSFKLENDAFAFPFLYFSLYFLLKFLEHKPTILTHPRKDYLSLIISFILLGIAGMFWGGAIFYLIAFLYLLLPKLTLFTLFISTFLKETYLFMLKLIQNIVANFAILENNPLLFFYLNFMYLMLLSFGIQQIVKRPWHATLTIIFILLSFLNPKLTILATPFISLYLYKNYLVIRNSIPFLNEKIKLPKSITKHPRLTKLLRTEINPQHIFILTGIILWIVYSVILLTLTPTVIQMQASQEIVELSKETGLPINNNWEYGHLIWYQGGQTKQHSGIGEDFQTENTLVLTHEELEESNCELEKTFEENFFIFKFRPDLYLYKCI